MSDFRIDPSVMEMLEVLNLMSEGNPGAFSVCMALLNHASQLDPDTSSAAQQCILQLDVMNIYGTRLYRLWNDVCKRDIPALIAICRAYEFGLAGINSEKLDDAINNCGAGIDLVALITKVQDFLPNFNR